MVDEVVVGVEPGMDLSHGMGGQTVMRVNSVDLGDGMETQSVVAVAAVMNRLDRVQTQSVMLVLAAVYGVDGVGGKAVVLVQAVDLQQPLQFFSLSRY